MTRAFITGISGQDGSYLAERLLAEGVEVHALAHALEPPPEAPGVELHRGDLTDSDEVRALLVDLAPDEVYNLAALSSVARSWEEPDLTARAKGLAAAARLDSALLVQEKEGSPGSRRRGCWPPRCWCRRSRADGCGSCRRPARRSSASRTAARRTSRRRSVRSTRTAPRRPSPTTWSTSPAPASCTP